MAGQAHRLARAEAIGAGRNEVRLSLAGVYGFISTVSYTGLMTTLSSVRRDEVVRVPEDAPSASSIRQAHSATGCHSHPITPFLHPAM